MAEAIIMPKTGMAMTEGVIIEWLKQEGDQVRSGDVIAQIETDKSTMEVESDVSGTLLKILYEEGTTVPVTLPIAYIGDAGEEIPNPSLQEPSPSEQKEENQSPSQKGPVSLEPSKDGSRIPSTPAAKAEAARRGIDLRTVQPSGKWGEIVKEDVKTADVSLTPLAKKIAEDRDVDLSLIQGSGHRGKIYARDLESKEMASSTRIALTSIQRITGRRMLESVQNIPMVSENCVVNVTRALSLKQMIHEESGLKVSVTDLVLKACSLALIRYPRLNAVFHEDSLAVSADVNIGMAVATDRGLLVPVIRNAHLLSMGMLVEQTRTAIDRAREGKLTPQELSGATFSISNLGMYGITSFTPIINPPESAILGVCAIQKVPRIIDGALTEVSEMTLSLTFDHRVADGAEAALFLKALVDYLEHPMQLMV